MFMQCGQRPEEGVGAPRVQTAVSRPVLGFEHVPSSPTRRVSLAFLVVKYFCLNILLPRARRSASPLCWYRRCCLSAFQDSHTGAGQRVRLLAATSLTKSCHFTLRKPVSLVASGFHFSSMSILLLSGNDCAPREEAATQLSDAAY